MVAIICACVARVDSIWAVSRSDDYRRCLQRIDITSFFAIRQSGTARALLFPTREIAINRRPTVGAPRQARLPTGTPLVFGPARISCWQLFRSGTEGHFGAPADRIIRRDLMTKATTTSLLNRRAFLAARLSRTLLPSGRRPRSHRREARLHRTDRCCSALIIAKEKGLFAKHGVPDVEVLKQASWGATRDNLVLGGGPTASTVAHILTPMPYLISTGKVTQNTCRCRCTIARAAQPRCQAISVQRLQGSQGRHSTARRSRTHSPRSKAEGKEVKVAMTFPGGTHDLWIRYWLAAGGIDPDKEVSTIVVPPAADGGQHEGRQHGRVLRRRAVERATRQPGHRLYRRHDRRALEGHPEKALGCAPTGSTPIPRPPAPS
jgi:hypothetical protein